MFSPIRRAAIHNDRNHLGDNISGSAYDNRVTNLYAQAFDFVAVVQGGIAHGNTTNKYRLQPGHRRNSAGASHLELHIQQAGHFLLGGKLACNSPTRCP